MMDVVRVWRCYAPPHSPKAWGLSPKGLEPVCRAQTGKDSGFTCETEGEGGARGDERELSCLLW